MAETDPTPLAYRSRGDAAGDDQLAMRRSMRTWLLLCGVWGVGMAVWAVYLLLIGYVLLRLLA